MIHYCEQGTEQWLECRRGKMTASHAQAIGNCGKGLDTYVRTVVADRIANKTGISGIKNAYTDHGHEHEATARGLYELETGLTVSEVGFVDYDDYSGCSPDGVIFDGDKIVGLIEIKCQDNPTHLDTLLSQKADSKYERQIQMQLLVTGGEWCDFVAYNPNFEQSMYIKRYLPDADMQEAIKKGLDIGTTEIKKTLFKFNYLYKTDE